jgi:hypothetical protein
MGDILMSVDKVQEMQNFLKNQENFLIKEEAEAALQAERDARGSWNENPEEDGFWISPDGSQMEVFGVDLGRLGPENDYNFGSNVAESENDEQTS